VSALVPCLLTTLREGCRSGKPGWELFGRRRRNHRAAHTAQARSTQHLSVPPSSRARPESIASIAGGYRPEVAVRPWASASVRSQTGARRHERTTAGCQSVMLWRATWQNSFDSGCRTGPNRMPCHRTQTNPAKRAHDLVRSQPELSSRSWRSLQRRPASLRACRSIGSRQSPRPHRIAGTETSRLSRENGYRPVAEFRPNPKLLRLDTTPAATLAQRVSNLGQKNAPASANGSARQVAAKSEADGANQSAKTRV